MKLLSLEMLLYFMSLKSGPDRRHLFLFPLEAARSPDLGDVGAQPL